MKSLPPTDFTIVLESSDVLAAGDTDSDVTPKKAMKSGTIRYFTAEVHDPALTNPNAHPDAYMPHIGVKLTIRGEPISGTGRNDFMPIRSLIGERGNPIPFALPVDTDAQVGAEFISFDDSGGATPDLGIKLVAHCTDAKTDAILARKAA